MKSSFQRFFYSALPVSLGLAGVSWAQQQNLSRSSPFIPSTAQSGPAATTENSPIELRGIVISPNGNLYGLYDPAKRQSSWVKLNETGNAYTVRSFNASNESIGVEYEGRMLTLALKAAKIDSMPASAVPPPLPVAAAIANAQAPTNNPGAAPAASAPAGSEAKRLEDIAAEVRRRRDARQSGAQLPAQTPGAAPSGGPPTPLPARSTPPNAPAVPPR